jgi:acyl-CoA thioester hydrolase
MSIVHVQPFTVREYECDAYGHLNNANYARFMQEAAFAASTAVGYPKERYEALGRLWLARATEIEFLQPVFYGERIEVKTWVIDFRHVRSLRQYEFYRGDELVAQARTDWVYMDRATEQVRPVPPEIIQAYSGSAVLARRPRPAFPEPPPPPAGAFTLRKRVEWRDIDGMQHLNNAAYFNYIEDCGIQVARHYGWPLPRYRAAGFAMIARRHHIVYERPAALDDELDITTWLFNARRTSALRHYEITRAGERIARAQTLWVAVSLETGRPLRPPADYADDFAPNIVS